MIEEPKNKYIQFNNFYSFNRKLGTIVGILDPYEFTYPYFLVSTTEYCCWRFKDWVTWSKDRYKYVHLYYPNLKNFNGYAIKIGELEGIQLKNEIHLE